MRLEEITEVVATGFEAIGVAIIVIGGVVALVTGVRDFQTSDRFFRQVRKAFARPLILGLEILVAADVMETITVDSSLESVVVLGILVAIRIALSFSLDMETDGMAPWSRKATEMMIKVAQDDAEQEN